VSLRDNGKSVELTWQTPADANGIILEYQIIYFGYKGQLPGNNQDFEVLEATKTANVQPDNTMTVITGLTASINYAFTVSYESNYHVHCPSMTTINQQF
jgi:hypothetical protein